MSCWSATLGIIFSVLLKFSPCSPHTDGASSGGHGQLVWPVKPQGAGAMLVVSLYAMIILFFKTPKSCPRTLNVHTSSVPKTTALYPVITVIITGYCERLLNWTHAISCHNISMTVMVSDLKARSHESYCTHKNWGRYFERSLFY